MNTKIIESQKQLVNIVQKYHLTNLWEKQGDNGEVYVAPVQQQSSIDTDTATSSYTYFEKLFCNVLYLVEEEMAFTKLKIFMTLQMNNELKFGATDHGLT